jgi:hypothetical protein
MRLLEEPGFKEQLAIESRKCVGERYAWSRAMGIFLALIDESAV